MVVCMFRTLVLSVYWLVGWEQVEVILNISPAIFVKESKLVLLPQCL